MDGLRNGDSGYYEITHTADWALFIWAPDIVRLLETAAKGMYYLLGIKLQPGERERHVIEMDAHDPEDLLVAFLSELLFWLENGTGFDQFDLSLEGSHLSVMMEGGRIGTHFKEIKAVTYHGLAIQAGE